MKKIVLCILDGCGIRESKDGNAFKNAKKPNFDMLINKYPNSLLEASGTSVGLPINQMGTSEVGHMNIGSGRIALQPLQAINKSIESKELNKNKKLIDTLNYVKNNNSNLHIVGLLSDGGVHSHINHLFGLLDICKENNIENIYLDIITDGRDTYEKSSLKYLDMLNDKLKELGIGKISTIMGRYYAMDRDNNFDRLKPAYEAMVYGIGNEIKDYKAYIENSYKNNITDEFLYPAVLNSMPIEDKDVVITFNFRKDRLRELFTCLSNYKEYYGIAFSKNLNLKKFVNLKTLTMFPVTNTVLSDHIFEDLNLKNILGEYLHNNNISQLRISETEKFPHVTFYFDCGKELEYNDIKKILIPSPKVKTYDLKPEMSVYEVTNAFLNNIDDYDVAIMNLVNGDMVGHTGNYNAAIKAVECLDECIGKIYNKVQELDGILMITADHGNCDIMWDEFKKPVTSHTLSLVPCIITKENIKIKNGKLADVAPTLLELMNLPIPEEMNGNSLIEK